MRDLAEILRKQATGDVLPDHEIMLVAADKIEYLQARVAELESQLDLARNQLSARISKITVPR